MALNLLNEKKLFVVNLFLIYYSRLLRRKFFYHLSFLDNLFLVPYQEILSEFSGVIKHLVSPLVCRGPWMSTVVLYCWCHSDGASVLLYFTFCHTCSLCRVELVVQFAWGVRLKCYYAFFLVCCGCDTSYIVSVHIQCQASIYTLFVVSRAFMAGAASQAGDADSFRAPGLTSGLQKSVNVHRGALLLVPQWRCISSFVFYM